MSAPLLILAGGLATRLKDLSAQTPKYLQPIDGANVFADLHLAWAARQGFTRVILSVGHLGEKIESHCGDGSRYGLEISYLFDGALPLGTGGAVRGALKFSFDDLAITYGDTLLRVPTTDFLREFRSAGLAAAMTVYRNQVPGHTCNANLESSGLVRYDKKSPALTWDFIDYGFLALKRAAIESIQDPIPFDLAVPLARWSQNDQLLGFEVKERFWEIGSPEALTDFRRLHSTAVANPRPR